jgi:hypothetical protein
VDLIWQQSHHVPPQPWGPPYDASMYSTGRMSVQSMKIDTTMKKMNIDLASLVSGHKKDVIITNQLLIHTKSVAIYGWHQLNGKPIQPIYLGHENTYADYSHGNRLISRVCEIDGQVDDIARIACDPTLCSMISAEGPLKLIRQP